jgi:uncharacterized protein YndB with AHSA1/START domain
MTGGDKIMATNNLTKITAKPGEREVVVTRVFDAPRELVFKAYNDPKLIPQWWGPRKYTTTITKMDMRPGGAWRFVQHDSEGHEYAFSGVFREIVPPKRIVWTFEFEGMPCHVSYDSTTFEEEDGKTKVTDTSVFQSVEDRDGMLQSGMETGVKESYERLDEVLEREAERTAAQLER